MNTAIVHNDQENVSTHGRSHDKNVLGAKRSVSGKTVANANGQEKTFGHGKKKLGGLSARRALGDISNNNLIIHSKGSVKKRPSRPVPRDEFGRIEEPEYLPLHSPMEPSILPPKIDIFADDDYGPAAPDSVRSVDAPRALFELQPANVAPNLSLKDFSTFDELDMNGLISVTSVFSEDELLPIDDFPTIELGLESS